jgi:branched-chain amino acid aminotransferase
MILLLLFELKIYVHISFMVNRGIKATPYQVPRVTISAATIVIIAEHKLAIEPK